jgi:uncharacterized protein (UPF0333 family)
MRHKRGQLDLSFGLIFSVILIITFLGFAAYAIVNFLKMKDNIETSTFLGDIQEDVNVFWRSSQSVDDFTYSLPKKIKEVCFIDITQNKKGNNVEIYDELEKHLIEGGNMIFYPIGSANPTSSIEIKHIDIFNMTETNNPLCFENKNGKVTLNLRQDFGGTNLVMIR